LRSCLGPSFADVDLARCLDRISAGDLEGLKQLLSLPDLFAVFRVAPGTSTGDRAVWEQISTAPPTATIVVCERNPGSAETTGWKRDRLAGRELHENEIGESYQRLPKTLALLAVLEAPITFEAL